MARKNSLPDDGTSPATRGLPRIVDRLLDGVSGTGGDRSGAHRDGTAPKDHADGSISFEPFPFGGPAAPQPALDEVAAARIAKLKRDSKLSLELDCFAAPFPFGEPEQRSSLPRMALCMDPSMFAYPPVLAIEVDPGKQMMKYLSQTIEGVGNRPSEALVNSNENACLMAPFR